MQDTTRRSKFLLFRSLCRELLYFGRLVPGCACQPGQSIPLSSRASIAHEAASMSFCWPESLLPSNERWLLLRHHLQAKICESISPCAHAELIAVASLAAASGPETLANLSPMICGNKAPNQPCGNEKGSDLVAAWRARCRCSR